MRILYIEDNATNVILVQRVANMGKHVIVNYDDGQEALNRFDEIKPDLILLDVQLRGELTGLDIARILREKGCIIPIIAVTAYAMKGDQQRCLDAGCDDYLPKPVSVAELVTVFKRYGDAVASGKPILSTFKLPPIVQPVPDKVPSAAEAAPVPTSQPAAEASHASVVTPVETAVPSTSSPTDSPVKTVDAVEPPITVTQLEPLKNEVPATVSAEP